MQNWKKIAVLGCGLICLLLIMTIYSMTSSKTQTKNETESNTMTVSHDHLQIREGPSTDENVIYIASKGETFVIKKKLEDWYKISNDRTTGFILRSGLRDTYTHSGKKLKLEGKKIVIDAGHGGEDNGATGATGVLEKNLTLKTATLLQHTLDSLGATVIMTRDNDKYVSLEDRVHIANNSNSDSFISIHYNSVPGMAEASGISTFYFDEQNKKLANILQNNIIKETKAKNRKTNVADFQVLKQNKHPAVLIELGFISNPEKEQLIVTDSYQQKLVDGIAKGLISFFAEKEDHS